MADTRSFFISLFESAVAAAAPARILPDFLPEKPKGRTVVIGAGKGASQMAQAFERSWNGPLSGVVVTRVGSGTTCTQIEVLEAAHPVPDKASVEAAQKLFDAVAGLSADDLVVALISGGGSALLAAPPPGMTLADEIAVNEALLTSGAPISEMNIVRKHLSLIKGGRLALAAHPARVASLIISDIPGDDPGMVASGPTVPSRSNRSDARAVIEHHRLNLPEAALRWLTTQTADAPAHDDPRFARNSVQIIASATLSLEAAAIAAKKAGIEAVILSEAMEGEAREIGRVHAAIAREIALRNRPFAKPVLLLSGGETTVTIRHKGGRGGRNSEFLLSFALACEGVGGIDAFAADTDGIDGSEENAGAFCGDDTLAMMRAAGVNPQQALARHDAWGAFSAIDSLFTSGPTGTNVNDIRMALIR